MSLALIVAFVVFMAERSRTADFASRLVPGWGPIPANAGLEWEAPSVALSPNGDRLYIFRRSNPPILEVDTATGRLLKSWGDDLFVWPHALTVDKDGNIWAADAAVGAPAVVNGVALAPIIQGARQAGRGHQVTKFTPDGRLLMTLGKAGVNGTGTDVFDGPTGVAIADSGDIFVSDGHTNARVVKFSKDGRFLKTWGEKGTGPGQFNQPHSIVIDARGRVLVGDRSNRRIQVFDQEGRFLAEWKELGWPAGMAIGPNDTLYVTDHNHPRKGIFIGSARDGTALGFIDGAESEGVAVDRIGTVYAAESQKHSIKKFVSP